MAAVTAGGTEHVSVGSNNATVGASCGLMMLIFTRFFVSVQTAQAVTSLPVPEVVGTAMIGGNGLLTKPMPP